MTSRPKLHQVWANKEIKNMKTRKVRKGPQQFGPVGKTKKVKRSKLLQKLFSAKRRKKERATTEEKGGPSSCFKVRRMKMLFVPVFFYENHLRGDLEVDLAGLLECPAW